MFTETELRDALAHSAARADALVPDDDRIQPLAPVGGWRRLAMPLLTAAMVAGTVVGIVVATGPGSSHDRRGVAAEPASPSSSTSTSPTASSTPLIRARVSNVEVRDEGTRLVIHWTGPATHDYAVVVAPLDGSVRVVPTNHDRRTTLKVTPGTRYCIAIQSTDGMHVVKTAPRGLRGATCGK